MIDSPYFFSMFQSGGPSWVSSGFWLGWRLGIGGVGFAVPGDGFVLSDYIFVRGDLAECPSVT